MGGEGGRVFKNLYKWTKPKGVGSWVGSGDGWGGGGEWRQLYLNNKKKSVKRKKKKFDLPQL